MIKKGFFWKMLERLGVSGVQFVLQIILARILSPEHYGALSIMIIFVNIANIFVQSGLNTALIQRQDVEEEDYSSVFVVSLAVATGLYALIFAVAPWIADFYEMPYIVAPMRVLALMLFPGAFNSVQLAKVSKEMDFKKVFYSNIGGVLVSGAAGITVAYMGGGLWALVVQSLLNVVVACVVMRFTVKLKLRLKCNLQRVKVLFSFGSKLLVSFLLETVYTEIQSLIIGKKYNSSTLGYYSRGKQFPQMISTVVNSAVQSVMLPAMSAEQDSKERVKSMTRTSMSMLSYIMFPVMAGLAATAPAVVEILLTSKWLPCVIYMQINCFVFAFYPIQSCNLQAINAMGRSDIFLKLEIVKKVVDLGILLIAVLKFETPVAIAASGIFTMAIGWVINAFPNKKLIGYSFKEQIIDVVPSILMSAVMFVIVYMIGNLKLNIFVMLCVQVLAGVVIYVLLSAIIRPASYKVLLDQIRKIVKR